MNYSAIIGIIIVAVLGGGCYFLKTKTKVLENIAKLIKEAEEKFLKYAKSGALKKEWVVSQLNKFIPKCFKIALTDKTLGDMVQNVFDEITEFINVSSVKVSEKVDKITEDLVEKGEDLMNEPLVKEEENKEQE